MQPNRKLFKFWKLVQRENAVRLMLISLFSFVATLSVVRSFLALTGYPQIGSGTLHIAHVLWGGLILYSAAILPLIYLNPRLHIIEAILSGVGMGLFIDEVGKFITREYDYFFPAAAPIMYIFFLLVVILVTMIRRPKEVDGRAELVQALETVREQLYRPLEPVEREHIERDLSKVVDTDPATLHQDMARRLLELVRSDPRTAPETRPAWWLRLTKQLAQWLTERWMSWSLGFGMVLLSLMTLKNPVQVWLEFVVPNSALVSFLQSHAGRQIAPADALILFNTRLVLEVGVGLLLLVSVGLLAAGKRRLASILAYLGLLISLVVLDMLLFYFEQFSTVAIVLLQFAVLFGVIFYRRKYLKSNDQQKEISF
jgi:hypothetical protein